MTGTRNLAELGDVVVPFLEEAAAIILAVRAEGFSVTKKEGGDPVTVADRRANDLLVARLRSHFPDIPVIAEESETRTHAEAKGSSEVWFVDPLDGTREFVEGQNEFATMVALVRSGRPVFGAIACPAEGRLFVGTLGIGAFERRGGGVARRCVVPARDALDGARVVVSRSRRAAELDRRIGHRGVTFVPCGSAGVKATRLLTDDADLYLGTQAGKLWDLAAPEALLTAAGAKVVTLEGEPIDYTLSPATVHSFCAASPALVETTLAAWHEGSDA